MDPLSALRDFTIRNKLDSITTTGDTYHFGDTYSFPAAAATAFRSKQGNPYSLETLIFFIRNHTHKHTDYIQSSRLHRIPPVTLPDRKPLFDYLNGLISSSDSIEHISAVHPYHPDNPSYSLPVTLPLPSSDNNISSLRSRERPLKDRDAILECRNRDFYGVIVASTGREEERHRVELMQRKDEIVAKTRLVGEEEVGEGVPIILVPSAFQTLITIHNVKEFLEDGVFVPSDAKARGVKGGGKPECVTVQKKLSRDRVVAAYEVRDKTTGFKGEDWERVVAVFVLGKEWQFKDWPFRDHVEIFNKIIGFYVRFEDDSVESAKIVKQWNVKIISISKNKRHQDRAAALEVWDRLEEFMRSRSHS